MRADSRERLALHLSATGMGLPYGEALVEILKENFSAAEAEAALLLPTEGPPLQAVPVAELAARGALPAEELRAILEGLAQRGLLYSGRTASGEIGYALHRVGFGFPQSFFWPGEHTEHAQKMCQLVFKYFNRAVTREAFGGTETKPYRYIPVDRSIKPDRQAVLPHDRMEAVIEGASRFAVAHCPCRVQAGMAGRACGHPTEVCLKFDEMAEYLIDRGLGREVSREEARAIIRDSAEQGLVHFVDNTAGKVKHNCNCCGCACWNVGAIRRRKIPRDVLMAVNFVRETDPERCTGCGACVEVCPVDAIVLDGGLAVVDEEWCIGCGVCATRCAFDALHVTYRPGKGDTPANFGELHARIGAEKERARASAVPTEAAPDPDH